MRYLIEYFTENDFTSDEYPNFFNILKTYDVAMYNNDLEMMIEYGNCLDTYMLALQDVFTVSRIREHRERLKNIIAQNYFEVKHILIVR